MKTTSHSPHAGSGAAWFTTSTEWGRVVSRCRRLSVPTIAVVGPLAPAVRRGWHQGMNRCEGQLPRPTLPLAVWAGHLRPADPPRNLSLSDLDTGLHEPCSGGGHRSYCAHGEMRADLSVRPLGVGHGGPPGPPVGRPNRATVGGPHLRLRRVSSNIERPLAFGGSDRHHSRLTLIYRPMRGATNHRRRSRPRPPPLIASKFAGRPSPWASDAQRRAPFLEG